MSSAAASSPFNVRVIGALIIAGIIGFIGFWAISAIAPQTRGGSAGGHGLSNSASGYAGIIALSEETGRPVEIIRNDSVPFGGNNRALLVISPPGEIDTARITERLEGYNGRVLIILPKHRGRPDPEHRGWERRGGFWNLAGGVVAEYAPGAEVTIVGNANRSVGVDLSSAAPFSVQLPEQVQVVRGTGLESLIESGGGTILARLPGRADTYVLSEPDLINNLAMGDPARATAALRLLRAIAEDDRSIGFDVTLNGLGSGGRSILQTAFTPPFLGLTLCLIAATLFALWQGFVRFGPAWREERKVALGKAGLIGNGAQLIVQARRVPDFAHRYGAMVREAAARRLHAPSALTGPALDRWLDRFVDQRGKRFSELLALLERSRSTDETVRGAAALGQWRKDVVRDSD
jgi:hypothetical protein